MAGRARAVSVIVSLLAAHGCCPVAATKQQTAPPTQAEQGALEVPTNSPFRTDAALRAKLKLSPHNYFRAINTEFGQEVCRRFDTVMATLPTVNLHGDLHLEQIAATERGAGLSDFDDSVSGPPVIDLVRFGVSVLLVARQRSWDGQAAVKAFLDHYADSLAGDLKPTAPAAVTRLAERFPPSRAEFLRLTELLMVGPPIDDQQEQGFARYTALMLQTHPDKSKAFFALKRAGAVGGQGIGSAVSKRTLYRIEGPTTADDDDLILEAKEIRDVSQVPCVDGRGGLSMRVVAGSLTFGPPDPFLAVVPRSADEAIDDAPWWIHSWIANYASLDVSTSLSSSADLVEVAKFAAEHLARGHAGSLPPPYDVQLRVLARNMLAEHRSRIETVIAELAQLAWRVHGEFR